MNKRIIYFIVIVSMVFIFSGCKHGDVTRGIRHAGFSVEATEFQCEDFLPKDDEDVDYMRIWYFDGNKIITNNGIIYEYSFDKQFVNGDYCKRSDFTGTVSAILDGAVFRAGDNRIYYLSSEGAVPYSLVQTDDSSYQLYQLIFGDPDVIKGVTVDSDAGIYYVLKSDGNIYKWVITKDDYNSPYVLRSSEIIYSRGTYGSIIDFGFSSDLKGNYIRTNSTIYRNIASNYDECNKYAGVECKYELKEDGDLALYLDRIIAYNGYTLITNYGRIFNIL